MKRIILCICLFIFIRTEAQQINPVPDYVFSNKMSVGRNAVTDTAAYFSIGPRYGAIRGMMPPMVTDTASMSATKRNGLLIFSIQKNKYLYWDSVGAKWAEMAGTAGSAITGSGVAGYMPEFTTSTNLDTTRLYHSSGRFAIGSTTTTNGVFNVYGGRSYFDSTITVNAHISTINLSDKSNSQNNKIETQDNRFVFSVDTSNAVADSRMIFAVDNSISMYLNSQEELIINADNEDRGDFKLQVILGSARIDNDIEVQANARLAQASGAVSIGTTSTTGVLNVSKSSVNTVFDSKSATDARIEYHRAGSRRSLFNWDSNVAGFQQESGVNFYISGTETLIGTQTDAGAYALQVAGSIYNTTGAVFAASSGEVLIGTTTDAGDYRLQVGGDAYFNGDIRLDGTTDWGIETSVGGEMTNFQIVQRTTNYRYLSIDSAGNLAFGRLTSGDGNNASFYVNTNKEMLVGYDNTGDQGDYKLQVNGAIFSSNGFYFFRPASTITRLEVANSTVTSRIESDAGNSQMSIGTASNHPVIFKQNDGLAFFVNTGKEIVMNATGVDAGAYKLQVDGNVYLTGSITTDAPSGGTAKPFKIGEAATVSPTSPNRTIRVEIDGTVYYIHAKTTND